MGGETGAVASAMGGLSDGYSYTTKQAKSTLALGCYRVLDRYGIRRFLVINYLSLR